MDKLQWMIVQNKALNKSSKNMDLEKMVLIKNLENKNIIKVINYICKLFTIKKKLHLKILLIINYSEKDHLVKYFQFEKITQETNYML